MRLVVIVPALCLALAGCNPQGRGGQNLTQDPGECGKFQWGTPEMALCLDTVAAARAAAERPVQVAQPVQPQPPPPAPELQPVAVSAPAQVVEAPAAEAPVAEAPVAPAPEAQDAPKSWWPWR